MPDLSSLSIEALLERFFRDPAAEAELSRRAAPHAVLAIPFADQAARAAGQGIGYALALATAAGDAIWPALAAHGAERIDPVGAPGTLLATLPTPTAALLAALDSRRALATFNRERTGHLGHGRRDEPLRAGIGVGFGTALRIPGRGVFGAELDRALRLGGEVARGGEVLVTDALLGAVGAPPEGVGTFRAPAEREAHAGFSFHVVGDHRG